MLELVAVVLLLETFADLLLDTFLLVWIDNEAVLTMCLTGRSRAIDANQVVGRLWLQLAQLRCGFYGARVESAANPIDGPTRGDHNLLHRLGAQFVEPRWPQWLSKIWIGPSTL